jgi:hypothetical protein
MVSWFGSGVAVIFTDSDPAMKKAIAAVFPDAQHLLCIWHLSRNMVHYVRAACTSDELWHRMLSKWWGIVKQSDVSSRAGFLRHRLGRATRDDVRRSHRHGQGLGDCVQAAGQDGGHSARVRPL